MSHTAPAVTSVPAPSVINPPLHIPLSNDDAVALEHPTPASEIPVMIAVPPSEAKVAPVASSPLWVGRAWSCTAPSRAAGKRLGTATSSGAWNQPWSRVRRKIGCCLLYTSDAADERSSVYLG